MADLKDRRAKLLQQKAQLDARLKSLDARDRRQARKDDTRRKVIAGGLTLKHAEFDQDFRAALVTLLNRYVDRQADRALFMELFPELPETPIRQEPASAAEQDQGSSARAAFKPAVG